MSEPNNAQYDELERQLLLERRHDPEVQTFLRDYARFKKQRGVKFFESVVGYHVFHPPSTFMSPFSPLKEEISFSDLLQSPGKEKMSFSELVQLLRPALQDGTTDCAQFL